MTRAAKKAKKKSKREKEEEKKWQPTDLYLHGRQSTGVGNISLPEMPKVNGTGAAFKVRGTVPERTYLMVCAENNESTARPMRVHWRTDPDPRAYLSPADWGAMGGDASKKLWVRSRRLRDYWRPLKSLEGVTAIFVALAAVASIVTGLTHGSTQVGARFVAAGFGFIAIVLTALSKLLPVFKPGGNK